MNGLEFDDAFKKGEEAGRQRAKELEQISTLQEIFNKAAGIFADRSVFHVQQVVERAGGELQSLTISDAKGYAEFVRSVNNPTGAAAFPEFDSLNIRDNKNGTFSINSGGHSLHNERSAAEVVESLGRFYGRLAQKPKL